jgi:hypothetical protein
MIRFIAQLVAFSLAAFAIISAHHSLYASTPKCLESTKAAIQDCTKETLNQPCVLDKQTASICERSRMYTKIWVNDFGCVAAPPNPTVPAGFGTICLGQVTLLSDGSYAPVNAACTSFIKCHFYWDYIALLQEYFPHCVNGNSEVSYKQVIATHPCVLGP